MRVECHLETNTPGRPEGPAVLDIEVLLLEHPILPLVYAA